MAGATERLDAEGAKAKALECREDAKRTRRPEHRIMLEHMADTWDRIARSLETGR
jgi:hypothetical protein